MSRPAAALAFAFLAAALAGCGGTRTVTETVTVSGQSAPSTDPVFFGHIRSLKRAGGEFQLEIDPAWFVTGVTAMRAKLADEGEEDVPNDYYIRDESDRVLTYRVPDSARITVLDADLQPLELGVAELADLVASRNPQRRQLYDRGGHLGYWLRAHGDEVRSLEQQYQP